MTRHKTQAEKLNEALDDIITSLLADYDFSPDEVKALSADLARDYEIRYDARNEVAYERLNDPERIAASDEAYRRQMRDAGRAHLLGDK